MRRPVIILIPFVLLGAGSCGGDLYRSTEGFYRATAEAKCRERGLAAETDEFRKCVRAVEEVEYRYWADRLANEE